MEGEDQISELEKNDEERNLADSKREQLYTIPAHQEMGEYQNSESDPYAEERELEKIIELKLKRVLSAIEESTECCIHRVPDRLLNANKAAYSPLFVSIGPLHNPEIGDNTFTYPYKQKMIEVKFQKLFCFQRESQCHELVKLTSYIRKEEERIRGCYSEYIQCTSDIFVEMVLLDASFIIMLFLRCVVGEEGVTYFDSDIPWPEGDIEQDLILFSNQLPFFILKGIYHHAFKGLDKPTFINLTFLYFSNYNNHYKSIPENTKHFTDLLRHFMLPESQVDKPRDTEGEYFTFFLKYIMLGYIQTGDTENTGNFSDSERSFFREHLMNNISKEKTESLPSATELQERGVKFQMSRHKPLLDIYFKNGKLVLPRFTVDRTTECFFRNLIALEQHIYKKDAKICDYVVLLDYLINTANDVELLVQKKILVNWLGDNQAVASLFNKLGTEISGGRLKLYSNISNVRGSHYSDLFEKLNRYCDVSYHNWAATLRLEYFKTPFRAASTIAAGILVVLTAIQTVYAVIGK